MKMYRIILTGLFLILISGCSTQQGTQPSLEKLAMISVIGFDYVDEDKMKMTVIMPQPAIEAQKHTQVNTVETDMLHKGLVAITSLTDKTVTLKQLRVILFSEEFARKGKMKEIMEYLFQDADVRSTTYVGIVKESTEEILRKDYPDKSNTSSYINNIFNPRQYTFFSPFTTIHEYIYDETNPLRDTIVPYVDLKDDVINLEGLAMFNNGKMETIFNKQEGKIIQTLRGNKKISLFAINLDDDVNNKEKVAMEFVKSKVKINALNMNSPKVTINIKLEGTLSEYKGKKDLTNKKEVERLEKEINKNINEDVQNLLEKCRDLSIEPVGMFETLRMHYKGNWSSDLTKQLLARAEFEVKVETKLMSVGALK